MTCIMQSSKKTLDTWEAEKLLNTSLAAKGALTARNAPRFLGILSNFQ